MDSREVGNTSDKGNRRFPFKPSLFSAASRPPNKYIKRLFCKDIVKGGRKKREGVELFTE